MWYEGEPEAPCERGSAKAVVPCEREPATAEEEASTASTLEAAILHAGLELDSALEETERAVEEADRTAAPEVHRCKEQLLQRRHSFDRQMHFLRRAEESESSPEPLRVPDRAATVNIPGSVLAEVNGALGASYVPKGWGAMPPKPPPLMIRDLDSDRLTPLEQADQLWQPMLVRDLDSNVLVPVGHSAGSASGSASVSGSASASGRRSGGAAGGAGAGVGASAGERENDPLNPAPPLPRALLHCALETATMPPPLSLTSHLLYRAAAERGAGRRERKLPILSAYRRPASGRASAGHFDVRWVGAGGMQFTARLELLPASGAVQEMLMLDDEINYYGFPRELGAIRTELLRRQAGAGAGAALGLGGVTAKLGLGSQPLRDGRQTERLLEVVIPRVGADGRVAQFRNGTVAGETLLSLFKGRRALSHMFVLHGRLSAAGRHRAAAELHIRNAGGEALVVFQAQRERGKLGGAPVWKMAYSHPLSTFQAFCVLLALQGVEDAPPGEEGVPIAPLPAASRLCTPVMPDAPFGSASTSRASSRPCSRPASNPASMPPTPHGMPPSPMLAALWPPNAAPPALPPLEAGPSPVLESPASGDSTPRLRV